MEENFPANMTLRETFSFKNFYSVSSKIDLIAPYTINSLMPSKIFKKIGILSLFALAYTLLLYLMVFIPILFGSTPLIAWILSHSIFIAALIVISFVPALFFQAALRHYNPLFVALLFIWYVLPAQWLGRYDDYSTLLWILMLFVFIFKTSSTKLSAPYWAFFIAISALLTYPFLHFVWTSDFSYHQGYEYWVSDHICYHLPSQWVPLFKEIHNKLPENLKKTSVSIVGLSPVDTLKFAKSFQVEDAFSKVAGMAIPNPFSSLVLLNLKDFSEEALFAYQDRQMLEKIIVHEMTHVEQAKKYSISFLFLPLWKKEAHATFVAKNFDLDDEYFALRSLEPDSWPDLKNMTQTILGGDTDYRFENYDFFQLQGWYYLGYLGMDLETFFSPAVDLADWMTLKEAWLSTHQKWLAQHNNFRNSDLDEF